MIAMKKTGKCALITGIAGQDGSFLAELLLSYGYEVHGIELPVVLAGGMIPPNLATVSDSLRLHAGSLTDAARLSAIVAAVRPDECYHLGAASFVSYAFEQEAEILAANLSGTHNLLAALKTSVPHCRLFFAGTSEMFGRVESEPQNEGTALRPRSVYGISKVAGYHLVNYYRQQHGMFSCTGFLFNHESPRRGAAFVTRKITMAVARIKAGLDHELRLGNLDALRDWGYAPDYVEAMHMMLQSELPDDYVIASGTTHSVRDFVAIAFDHVGLDYRDYVVVDPAFYREVEPVTLRGDSARIEQKLHWQPTKLFAEIVVEMVEHDLRLLTLSESI